MHSSQPSQPQQNQTPLPQKQTHPALPKINYLINCELDETEIGIARVRAFLIPDAGILPSGPRFLDDPLAGGIQTKDPEEWKRKSKDKDQIHPSLPTEKFDSEISDGSRARESREVEAKAKLQFGNIEMLLAYLQRKFGTSGTFVYPGFTLAEFANREDMRNMVKEIAEAFASLIAEDRKFLRDLPKDEKDLAIKVLAEKIISN